MYATEAQLSDDLRPEPVPLGLRGLAGAIAAMGNLTVTIDGVPDAARLSAGQFLGDGVWSVVAQDLDGLALFPSPGRNRNCRLSIRLRKIDKDMGDAFSVGAVYVDVDADSGRAAIAGTDGAISLKRRGANGKQAPRPTEARPAFSEPVADPSRDPISAPEPVKRIVRVTRTTPAPPPPTIGVGASTSPFDMSDGELENETALPPDAFAADEPETAIANVASPWPAMAAEPPWPLHPAGEPANIAPAIPPDLDDLPVPVPSAPLAGAVQSGATSHDPGVVPVRVAPGLRIGRFGKTGRPEDVVAVRGRGAAQSGPRTARSGSVVFVRQAR